MRILLTNARLDVRGGAEAQARVLARGLNRLGHSVVAYTSDPRYRQRLLENDRIPVVTELERLPFTPDLIHARHCLDAMSALAALPGVPAIYQLSSGPRISPTLEHPRIYRYLAPSAEARLQLEIESGVPGELITIFTHAVDLERLGKARPAAREAKRALYWAPETGGDAERESAICLEAQQSGFTVDSAEWRFGDLLETPVDFLEPYDVVFASADAAIEAAVRGCAVVIAGPTGPVEMLLPSNLERQLRDGFTSLRDSPRLEAGDVARELARYAPGPVSEVTTRLREESGLTAQMGRLLAVYEDAVARHRAAGPDPRQERLATVRYLRNLAPALCSAKGAAASGPALTAGAEPLSSLSARLDRAEAELAAVRAARQKAG